MGALLGLTESTQLLAARGRGLARLIEGVTAGDPWAIGILVVVVLVIIGSVVMKSKSGDE